MFNIWFFLTVLLDTLPVTAIHYMMYNDKLRFPFVKSLSITAVLIVLYDFFICFLFFNNYISVSQSMYLRISIFIILLFLKFYLIPKYILQNIYMVMLVLPYVVIIIALSAMIISNINIENTPPYMVMTLLRAGFIVLTSYPVYLLWNKEVMPALEIKDKRIWYLAIGVQFFLNLGVCSTLSADYAVNGIERDNLFIILILMVATMFTTVLFFYAINVIRSNVRMEEYSEREKMLLQLQEQQYAALTEKIEQSRRTRHDIRHHASLVQELLEDGKVEEAKRYMAEYSSRLTVSKMGVYCENYAINALLNHYVEMADEENIRTDIKCAALADFTGSDTDLSIAMGNAFENAIEACRKLENERERFISISANVMAGQLYITIDNSYDGNSKKESQNFLSSKRGYSSMGFGMSSIASVANKYGGQIHIDEKDNVFSLSIMMKIG